MAEQPSDSKGAWVRFRKKGSSIASVTKAQAIDSALCYGWIDGQLDKYDVDSWLVRFTLADRVASGRMKIGNARWN